MFDSVQQKIYRRQHREEFRIRQRKYHLSLKRKVVEKLGGSCSQCGIQDIRVLCVHHKNGGGLKDRKYPEGQVTSMVFYRRIVLGERIIGDLELLCMNCHTILHSKLPIH